MVDSNKQSPSCPPPPVIHAILNPYFLTPPSTVEHPERHLHTGDNGVDESDSDESEREHPGENDVEETDLAKTGREEQYDTDGRK